MAKLESSDNLLPWVVLLEALVAGITHNISNRVAIVSGISDILSEDDPSQTIVRALAAEIPRLEESLRLLRLLPTPDQEAEEPLEVSRVVEDALALARVHPDAKGYSFESQVGASFPPGVALPTRLLHDLVMLVLTAAFRPGTGAEDHHASADVVHVVVRVVVHAREVGNELIVSVGDRTLAVKKLLPVARS